MFMQMRLRYTGLYHAQTEFIMYKKTPSVILIPLLVAASSGALAAGGGAVLADPGAMQGKHFDPKGKMPSTYTVDLQNERRKTLPFEDKRDFEEAKKGFIAAPP